MVHQGKKMLIADRHRRSRRRNRLPLGIFAKHERTSRSDAHFFFGGTTASLHVFDKRSFTKSLAVILIASLVMGLFPLSHSCSNSSVGNRNFVVLGS